MQGNVLPNIERILPASLWERFSEQYKKATGCAVVAYDPRGRLLAGGDYEFALCAVGTAGGRKRCSAFYQKVAQQAVGGEDAVLFRCPYGFLVFGVPVRLSERAEGARVVLIGGPAQPQQPSRESAAALSDALHVGAEEAMAVLAKVPVISPQTLMELAHLGQMCLRWVAQGNAVRETYAQRQAQVMTLFEVSSDLAQTSSGHELYALALNTLGVLFDVGSAAILLYEQGSESYRTHTAMGSMEKALLSWSVAASAQPLDRFGQAGVSAVHVDDPHTLAKLGLPEETERLAAFSLWDGKKAQGILVLLNKDVSGEEEHMIRGLATQLSLAMENRRLQEEIVKTAKQLRSVQELGRQFLTCLEPERLFEAILEEAQRMTGARRGSVMVEAEAGGELLVKAVAGMNHSVVPKLRVRVGKGVAGRVFSTGEAILVRNVEADSRFRRRNRPRYATKSFISFPIQIDGRTVGVLNLSDKVTGDIFSDEDLTLLRTMSAQATIAIERSSYYAQNQELRKISITDPLTGLLNRRYFQERLTEEVDRATRHGHPMSLIMIDIDHFKTYNDANGHPAGDKALVLVGRALRSNIRAIDVVSRFGGEEFAVIVPETRKTEALEIGERIRADIEELYFPGEETLPSGRLTISLGVAGFPEDARDLKALIQKADRALYHAKAQGRNQIVAYSTPESTPENNTPPWTKVL